MKRKDLVLNILGVALIVMGIFRLWQIIFIAKDFPRYFWLCNFAPLIFGFGVLFRSSFILIGEFSALFLGQGFWVADFFFYLFTRDFLTGGSSYILHEPLISQIASVSVHLLVLPMAFAAILIIGEQNKNAWKFSPLLFAILLPIVLYYGPEFNLNLLFYPSFSFLPKIPFYSFLFPLSYIFFVSLPLSMLMNYIVGKWGRR